MGFPSTKPFTFFGKHGKWSDVFWVCLKKKKPDEQNKLGPKLISNIQGARTSGISWPKWSNTGDLKSQNPDRTNSPPTRCLGIQIAWFVIWTSAQLTVKNRNANFLCNKSIQWFFEIVHTVSAPRVDPNGHSDRGEERRGARRREKK